MIQCCGAQGTIHDVEQFLHTLQQISKKEGILIQALNARLVYGSDHLLSAVKHARRAFLQHTNATNSLELELLLYAAGERQIQKAIQKIGVTKGKNDIAFVLIHEKVQKHRRKPDDDTIKVLLTTFQLQRNDKVLEGDRDTLKRFGITEKELHGIPESTYGDLILEKVALVDIIK